ncbi:TetR family transcriptional regulator [Amycolatopsis cynarae]|uniref:TetR family transcriptional regulator n=1 Tax=Amycolatopsis cynarae TaxID=2995223 RepID=A0ABY7AUE5_9PSEU|nr:TetR family transcriptional regulator [Amycolatopsis sp. HUAS 11-8]WAL63387.1 TetR family transcriptional regulator [Amycolatopsis sp. HUAS 11-8]
MTKRSWAGTTLTDRKAARREQLLAAALELLGTGGSAAVSVRAVCREAKLTERYFYENFTDREELVLAVYERVAGEAHQALVDAVPDPHGDPAVRAAAAVGAFVELIVDDPRKGRVLLLAPTTDPALSARGVALLPAFAALVREQLPERMSPAERELTATGLVGALANLFTGYLGGTLNVSREELTGHCVHLLARAGY